LAVENGELHRQIDSLEARLKRLEAGTANFATAPADAALR